jgi:hypothetical protein
MKLEVVPGVELLVDPEAEPPPPTPPVFATTLAAPWPFGHKTGSGLSSIDVETAWRDPLVGDTT